MTDPIRWRSPPWIGLPRWVISRTARHFVATVTQGLGVRVVCGCTYAEMQVDRSGVPVVEVLRAGALEELAK